MNIEKIKNYNQMLLALAGTLCVVLLLIFMVWLISELPFFNRPYSPNNSSGLIADNKIENLNRENLRKQIISYESPRLVDTLKSVYIIPVSITTLKKPEKGVVVSNEVMSSMDVYPDFNKTRYYKGEYYEGNYANLIVYHPLENRILSLFKERILISGIQAYYFKDDILLVFYSVEKDTDKDGTITMNDVKNLCMYSFKTESLSKISDGENSAEQYQFIENTKDLMIAFSLNQYNEKQFNNSRTPNKIMKYEYDSRSLTDIIPQKIQADMQKLVEGK